MKSVRVSRVFAVLLFFSSSAIGHSAEPSTLAAAVDKTLRSNPDLAVSPACKREQVARIELAGLRPQVAIDAQVENVLGSGAYRDLEGAETSLSLSQVIELGEQRRERLAAARGGMDAFELDQTVAQLDAVAKTTPPLYRTRQRGSARTPAADAVPSSSR